jgi:hypothetical protein
MRTITTFTIAAALAGGLAAAPAAVAKHGADDPVGHVRHGRGSDDGAGHVRHSSRANAKAARRGDDDARGHRRHGRGSHHGAGHR